MNRKVEYALMALKYMSTKYGGQLTTAKEISEVSGVPFDATARVMQIMAQNGLLKSEQGAHGGYLIACNLARVSFHQLLEMILGPLGVVKCLHAAEDCEMSGHCSIQSPLSLLNQKLVGFYSELTLQDLLQTKDLRREKRTEPLWAEAKL